MYWTIPGSYTNGYSMCVRPFCVLHHGGVQECYTRIFALWSVTAQFFFVWKQDLAQISVSICLLLNSTAQLKQCKFRSISDSTIDNSLFWFFFSIFRIDVCEVFWLKHVCWSHRLTGTVTAIRQIYNKKAFQSNAIRPLSLPFMVMSNWTCLGTKKVPVWWGQGCDARVVGCGWVPVWCGRGDGEVPPCDTHGYIQTCSLGYLLWTDRMTDTTEQITFPQLHWLAVIILFIAL